MEEKTRRDMEVRVCEAVSNMTPDTLVASSSYNYSTPPERLRPVGHIGICVVI